MSNRVPNLPILGEPLIAEFANTLYIDETSRLDVLDHPAWMTAWLRQAPCAADLATPHRLRSEDTKQLRVLRDAVRRLLACGRHYCAADIEIINTAARSEGSHRLLASSSSGQLEVISGHRSHSIESVLSAMAISVLDSVERGTFDLHQVCSRPGCNLFFFRDHHRRRYCNPRCANADRQARYNARRAEPSRTGTTR